MRFKNIKPKPPMFKRLEIFFCTDISEIKKIYLFGFLNDFMPIYTMYTYIIRQNTPSFDSVAFFITTIYFFKLIGDIPIGIISDKCSRVRIISLANIMRIIAIVIWMWVPNIKILLFTSCALWGLSMSCLYGTVEPYLFDIVKSYNNKRLSENFGIIMGRYYSVQGLAIFLSSTLAILTGFFFSPLVNKSWIIAISIASQCFGFLVLSMLPSSNYKNKDDLTNIFSFEDLICILKNTSTLYNSLLKALGDSLFIVSIDMITSTAHMASLSSYKVAAIVAANSCIKVIGNFFVGYGSRVFQKYLFIYSVYLCSALLFIMAFFFNSKYFMIFSFSAWMTMYTTTDIGCQILIQKNSPSNIRSSVFGFVCALSSIMSVFLVYIISLITSQTSHNEMIFGLIISSYIFFFSSVSGSMIVFKKLSKR